jgi:hypothetical protein
MAKSKALELKDRLQAGKGKTYFFDGYETEKGGRYLSITESRREGNEFVRQRITIFKDQLPKFYAVLAEAKEKLEKV